MGRGAVCWWVANERRWFRRGWLVWGQSTGVLAEVERLLAPVIQSCGLSLWGCEWAQEQSTRILRVYIDAEQGVSLDDCEHVSRQISPLLDVEDVVSGEYSLEVSSPGMERPLFSLTQCEACCGQIVRLALHQPVAGRRKLQGVLKAVDGDGVVIEVSEAGLPEAGAAEACHVSADRIRSVKLWPF